MKGKALSILLYVTAAAISCQNAPVTEENPGEDGSPIIEFSDRASAAMHPISGYERRRPHLGKGSGLDIRHLMQFI